MNLHCIVCTHNIPEKRVAQRSNTCSKECKSQLKAFFRAEAHKRKCRHCNHPSTPQERLEFQQWRRDQKKASKAESKHATAATA